MLPSFRAAGGARLGPRVLLLATLVLLSCDPAPPTVVAPACQPVLLAVEGTEQIRGYEVSASRHAPLSTVSLPPGFRNSRVTPLGGDRVAIAAWNDTVRRRSFGIWMADLRSGKLDELVMGEDSMPEVAALGGDRLVLGWLGRNVVTPATVWQPSRLGERDWLAIDARGDDVLVLFGMDPAPTGAGILHLSPTIAVEPLAGRAGALDAGSAAALSAVMLPELAPDRTALVRVTSSERLTEIELPGRYVGFGSSERYLALMAEHDGKVRLGIKDRSGSLRVVEITPPSEVGGGRVVFAGAYVAVTLQGPGGETYDSYVISPDSRVARLPGSARPIAALVSCDGE